MKFYWSISILRHRGPTGLNFSRTWFSSSSCWAVSSLYGTLSSLKSSLTQLCCWHQHKQLHTNDTNWYKLLFIVLSNCLDAFLACHMMLSYMMVKIRMIRTSHWTRAGQLIRKLSQEPGETWSSTLGCSWPKQGTHLRGVCLDYEADIWAVWGGSRPNIPKNRWWWLMDIHHHHRHHFIHELPPSRQRIPNTPFVCCIFCWGHWVNWGHHVIHDGPFGDVGVLKSGHEPGSRVPLEQKTDLMILDIPCGYD